MVKYPIYVKMILAMTFVKIDDIRNSLSILSDELPDNNIGTTYFALVRRQRNYQTTARFPTKL